MTNGGVLDSVEEPAHEDQAADAVDAVDEHPLTVALLHTDASRRALLAAKLSRSPGIQVTISTGDFIDGVEAVIETLPDVVALLPNDDLLEAVERLERDAPASAVLILDPGPEHFGALALGARGTLPSGGSEITKAVLGVARDETVLTPDWAEALLTAIDELDDRVRRLALLTESEREVLTKLADGIGPRDIADEHAVPERFVNLHIGYAVAKYQRAVEAYRAVRMHEAAVEMAEADAART